MRGMWRVFSPKPGRTAESYRDRNLIGVLESLAPSIALNSLVKSLNTLCFSSVGNFAGLLLGPVNYISQLYYMGPGEVLISRR